MLANQSITSLESVLDLAVWLEKHGQAFYESARDTATDPGLKDLFDTLAAEEKRHIQQLMERRELLRRSSG